MVTPLSTELLEFVLPVFSFILIYAILFAILQKSKIFGDTTGINAWVAFAISVIFVLTPGAMQFVREIAPWFVVLVFIGFSLLLIFMFFGTKEEKIAKLAEDATVQWIIFIIAIIIVVAGLIRVFGPIFGQPSTAEGGAGREIQRSIFNVKVLSTVILLVIASFAVKFISQSVDLKK